MSKPVTWSFSSLNKFLTCPKQYYELNVAKSVKQESTVESQWGERVHEHIERELTTRTKPDAGEPPRTVEGDPALAPYASVIERFSQTPGNFAAEQKLAITHAFKPTEWLAPDVWCRGILDAVWIDGELARVVDWKSGKRRADKRQLELFALLTFAHYPEVQRVNTAYVWLQTGKVDVQRFTRKEIPVLWQDFLPDVRRLEHAFKSQTWVPKPSGLCKSWCPVMSCSFNGRANEKRGEVVNEV